MLKLAFNHSDPASANRSLDEEGVVNGHRSSFVLPKYNSVGGFEAGTRGSRDILSKLEIWHRPRLDEMELRGLLISEGWQGKLEHILVPLAVTVLFFTVIAAKLVYGDWKTAWNVGCSMVSLATITFAWVNHCTGQTECVKAG